MDCGDGTNLLEQTIKVNVHDVARVNIKKDIFAVTIPEAIAGSKNERNPTEFEEGSPKDKSNHGHHSECSTIVHSACQPRRGLRERFYEPVMEDCLVSMRLSERVER